MSVRCVARGPRVLAVTILLLLLLTGSCGESGRNGDQAPPPVTQVSESPGARLELRLDRAAMTTAESALLRLELECAETDSVEFPDLDDGVGGFAVTRSQSLPDRLGQGGTAVRGHEYVLQPFLPGDYEIPALTVVRNGTDEIATEPLTVVVESVIEDTESPELRDIADPIDVPVPWWWWVVGALLLVAVLAGAAWWLRRRRMRQLEPRIVPPHEAALNALDALLGEDLLARGEFESFYLRLSDIVRHYIENRFGLRAPERTTEEFLAELTDSPEIRGDHQRLLRRFLQEADLVKFAKVVPAAGETGASVDAARSFIEQTVAEEVDSKDGGGLQQVKISS